MSRFMVGDRVKVKNWHGERRPDFLLVGTIVTVHGGGWYTVKHDDVKFETYRRAKGRYDSFIGPRYDWQAGDLTHICGLLRFLDSIDDKQNRASA